jgi:DNA-binding HxlR family transcriptional regulator
LTGNTVNGGENGAHSGAQTLTLLGSPLNFSILRALADGPRRQSDVRRETGSPAQSTLRAQLKRLTQTGVIERHLQDRFPGTLECQLTDAGDELLFVVSTLEGWLDRHPSGPLSLGGTAAKAAVNAFTEGWSTTMLRALAAEPLSLTELDRLIGPLSYPSLERRLAAMRLAGLVEARPANGRGTPYAVTDWLRQGMAPLAAAARWERRHQPNTTPRVAGLDVETGFLLAVPRLSLPKALTGTCRLAAEVSTGKRPMAGVTVEVARGAVVFCTTKLEGKPDARALGSIAAWLSAVIDNDLDRLQMSGDCRLSSTLVKSLHRTLFEAHRDAPRATSPLT